MTTLTHYDEGTLRAYLDHEALEHDAMTAHIRDCLDCKRQLKELRANAYAATSALDSLATVELDEHAPTVITLATPTAIDPPAPRRRMVPMIAAAAALVLAGTFTVATPAGRSMADEALRVFRSESVKPLEITQTDATSTVSMLSIMTRTGQSLDSKIWDQLTPTTLPTLAAAQRAIGLDIAVPTTLPDGIDSTPRDVTVSQAATVTMTFDRAATEQYIKDQQSAPVQIPEGFDGTTLTIHFPESAVLDYVAADGRFLVVGTAAPVQAETTAGLTLDQLVDVLSQMPGVSPQMAEQLRGTDLASGTLPIPLTTDTMTPEQTQVAGHDGILINQPGMGSGLMWQDGQRILGVVGAYDEDTIRGVADTIPGDTQQ